MSHPLRTYLLVRAKPAAPMKPLAKRRSRELPNFPEFWEVRAHSRVEAVQLALNWPTVVITPDGALVTMYGKH